MNTDDIELISIAIAAMTIATYIVLSGLLSP